jgi:hypothetical protein
MVQTVVRSRFSGPHRLRNLETSETYDRVWVTAVE